MRERKTWLVVTFHTTAAAIGMEKLCAARGLAGRLIPVPRALTADCGVRVRANIFHAGGALSFAIRLLNDVIPEIEDLDLPPIALQLPTYPSGLVLITGETGSGKSTTLAAVLNRINHTACRHIMTL